MTADVAHARLHAQHLLRPLAKPVDVVEHLVAVQSQDYYGATWALAQRSKPTTFDAIDRAYSAGEILRTHVLRPTWHFVTPADARWLLELTGPRVQAKNAFWYKQSGLTAAKLAKTDAALADALRGGNYLTRDELAKRLSIKSAPMSQVMMHAELERVVISGPRRGKVMTYALFDERVPPSPALSRDDSLALLARRYVTSHGPAQVADFVWWSGLTTAESRRALELANLTVREVNGLRYYAAPAKAAPVRSATVHLLPNYDEYLVAFADRSAAHAKKYEISVLGGHFAFSSGKFIGNWRRRGTKHLECILTAKPSAAELAALEATVARFAKFFGLTLQLKVIVDRARTRTGRTR